jgi:hypothetical protein
VTPQILAMLIALLVFSTSCGSHGLEATLVQMLEERGKKKGKEYLPTKLRSCQWCGMEWAPAGTCTPSADLCFERFRRVEILNIMYSCMKMEE